MLRLKGHSTPIEPGTVFGIGRNYRDHAAEMGTSVPPEPLVFVKPRTALVTTPTSFLIPPYSRLVHYEFELVVLIGKPSDGISPTDANNIIAGYGGGLDMTLRDLQDSAKKKGEPWSLAKGFRGSAPVSEFIPANLLTLPTELILKKNGKIVQHGNTDDMERSPQELVSYIAERFGLRPGDCIFTGTPAGVGPVQEGDTLEGLIGKQQVLNVQVAAPSLRVS